MDRYDVGIVVGGVIAFIYEGKKRDQARYHLGASIGLEPVELAKFDEFADDPESAYRILRPGKVGVVTQVIVIRQRFTELEPVEVEYLIGQRVKTVRSVEVGIIEKKHRRVVWEIIDEGEVGVIIKKGHVNDYAIDFGFMVAEIDREDIEDATG